MHKRSVLICILSLILALCVLLSACSEDDVPDEPGFKERNSVRVGCIVAEEYPFFMQQMYYMAEAFSSEGLIGALPYDLSSEGANSASLWQEICRADTADGMILQADSYYNYDLMDDAQKTALLNTDSVDLMIVFGTAAGVWLTNNADALSFDYMVFASADPVTAGIVKSKTERMNDRSFAHVDPGRIKRQLELTYEISQFRSIGVVYEDSSAAYSYSGIRFLEELSELHGFAVHTVHVDEPKDDTDYDRYYQELKDAYHSMLGKIDVLFVTTGMIEDEKLPWLLEEVHEAGIITVAESTESQVEYGAMIHITMSDAREEGQFAARTLTDYLSGVPISELDQVFLITPHISLNQTTIEKTGAAIPMSIYLIADSVYRGVKNAE